MCSREYGSSSLTGRRHSYRARVRHEKGRHGASCQWARQFRCSAKTWVEPVEEDSS